MRAAARSVFLLIIGIAVVLPAAAAATDRLDQALGNALSGLDRSKITTGILYDRVVPLSGIEAHDGGPRSRPLTLAGWKQIHHEMSRASLDAPAWRDLATLLDDQDATLRRGVIPIALVNMSYQKIRSDALDEGLLEAKDGRLLDTGRGDPFSRSTVFAATALEDVTYRGGHVVFALDRECYLSNDATALRRVEVDFDDGRGFRDVGFGDESVVRYSTTGRKTIRIGVELVDGRELGGSFYFRVAALQTPMPHDTLSITATIPYSAVHGTGQAYVYRSDANSVLTRPVILVEGFDIGNTMNWDELYELTNQEGLMDSLRASGYDAVVLNFTDAVDYIQRNAFVLVELIQQVEAMVAPSEWYSIVGASMGGLVTRYALSYMETHSIDHRVRLFMSFDSPQKGANIPLGVQHWVDFFAGQSTEAASLLEALNSPAARQMLVYHHAVVPTTSAGADPMRVALESDLAAVGEYPQVPENVAVANGSSMQMDQGFAAGDQIIHYEFSNFLVDITGNVWAVSAGPMQLVFDGLIDIILLPKEEKIISVGGTAPYDNAPGGYRGSMADMDSTEAPYGDIVALYDNHCFIPTISALDLDTTDLFFDVAGEGFPFILDMTPFADIYVPAGNEEHVTITPESSEWILAKLRPIPSGAIPDPVLPGRHVLRQNTPNPFNPTTTIGFYLSRRDHARLSVFAVDGRLVTTLVNRPLAAGPHHIDWNGRDGGGQPVASGVYFYRLEAGSFVGTRKMLLLK